MLCMHILIATGIYPPSVGGPATYSKLLHDELPKRGATVEVMSFDSVRALPTGVRHVLYFFKLLLAAIGKDVIYAQDPVSVGYPAMWVARLLRKPLVLKIVGDYAWEQGVQRFGVTDLLDVFVQDKVVYHDRVMQLKHIQKTVAEHATRIIVPSQYLKHIVTQWGIAEEKITVVYNAHEGSDTEIVSYRKARAELDVHTPTIVTAGRLVPWKGFATLITLMPALIQKIPKLKLMIIGSGPDRDRLEQLIQKEKLYNHVVLCGALPQEELFLHISAADVFVLNTGYEGFSHQLLEVLAIGAPIVTTSVGGNPEVITDGVNGLLVPYDDQVALQRAIETILSDDALSNRFKDEGKQTVSVYTKDRLLQETVTVLTSAL
jgi:glycosyltransferase involved in cell wall biosynthesis